MDLSSHIEKFVDASIRKAVDEKLPGAIRRILRERVFSDLNRPLTKAGFGWALSFALRDHWPEISDAEAASTLWKYLDFAGASFGDDDYEWTSGAAIALAAEYAGQFGESSHG